MIDGMYFSRRSRPFQFGITTLAEVLFGRWFAAQAAFLRNSRGEIQQRERGHRDRQQDREKKDQRKSLNKPPEDDQERFHYFERSGPSPTVRPIFTQRDARIISSCAASSARCASAVCAQMVRSRTRGFGRVEQSNAMRPAPGTWLPAPPKLCAPIRS